MKQLRTVCLMGYYSQIRVCLSYINPQTQKHSASSHVTNPVVDIPALNVWPNSTVMWKLGAEHVKSIVFVSCPVMQRYIISMPISI
jgi:hypothetical protein